MRTPQNRTKICGLTTILLSSILGTAGLTYASGDPSPSPSPAPSGTPSPAPTPKILASFNGMLSARYDHSTKPTPFNRLQESVVFGFTITPAGIVDLVGMIQTGSGYGKRFQTAVDFNDHSKDQISPTLYFKHLYLQKSFKTFGLPSVGQMGVLGSNQKIGTQTLVGPTTAMGTNTWSEGARYSIQTKVGDFSVTGGSITDMSEPEIQKRKPTLNYVEIQVSRKIFDKLTVEASGGKYDGEIFFRGAAEYDVQTVAEHMIRLIQEGFYSKNNFSYSTSASTDLGALFSKKLDGRINIDLRYSYVNPDAGARGLMMNDVLLKGHVLSAALYGKVDRTGRLNWFTAKDFLDVNRFQAGVNWKFKGGNKK